ncbi:hypothetical protein CPC08DRAFT_788655, partial [Agrocybe pediades]
MFHPRNVAPLPVKILVHGDSDNSDLIPGPRYPSEVDMSHSVVKNEQRSVRGMRRSTPPSIITVNMNLAASSTSAPSNSLPPSAQQFENTPFTQSAPTYHSPPVTPVRLSKPRLTLYIHGYSSDDLEEGELRNYEASLRRMNASQCSFESPPAPPSSPTALEAPFVPSGSQSAINSSDSNAQFRGIILPLVDAANETWLAKNLPPWRVKSNEEPTVEAAGSAPAQDDDYIRKFHLWSRALCVALGVSGSSRASRAAKRS